VRRAKSAALKLCKACKNVEEPEVSGRRAGDFHKLINTCVENFTEQKYSPSNSVSIVLGGARATL
jgi:hypothetical protein